MTKPLFAVLLIAMLAVASQGMLQWSLFLIYIKKHKSIYSDPTDL